MSQLEKSRLIRAMKVTTDAILVLLTAWFVLSLFSKRALNIASGDPFYIMDGYGQLSILYKIIFNFLVTGKIALFGFIFYQLRKIFLNISILPPFEKDNISRVRKIGISIMLLCIFPFLRNEVLMSQQNVLSIGMGSAIPILMYIEIAQSLFIGVIVLVVAEVFRRGAEMYNDLQLTV